MKLVLDTNVIHGDFLLHGPRITKLCSAAPSLGYEVLIPEVDCDEMVNQYRKKLLQNMSGYSAVVKMIDEVRTGTKSSFEKDAFINKSVVDYKPVLLSRLHELGINIIPYPRVDAKRLVSKDLLQKKPFREVKEETIGLCDAMIWESIMSICDRPTALIEDPQIEFLCANTKDFAISTNTLHPDLVSELKEAGFLENCVELISEIDDFIKKRIDAELEELNGIKSALLKTGKFNRFNLAEEASKILNEDFMEENLLESDFDSGNYVHLSGYCEDPTIRYVNEPKIKEIEVRRLADQTVLIEAKTIVLVEMDYFVYAADYYLIDDDKQPAILDDNWNDHYYWVEGTAEVTTALTFRTTAKVGKVLSQDAEITDVEL